MLDFCENEHKLRLLSINGSLNSQNQLVVTQFQWCSECGAVLQVVKNENTQQVVTQTWYRVFGREARLRDKQVAEYEKRIKELEDQLKEKEDE